MFRDTTTNCTTETEDNEILKSQSNNRNGEKSLLSQISANSQNAVWNNTGAVNSKNSVHKISTNVKTENCQLEITHTYLINLHST